MIKGFKDFLLRGNVVDMAVAIAVGMAFVALVASFGEHFIDPLVASFGGDAERGWGFQMTESGATFVNIGAIINALVVFVVTMAVIYFAVVVPMNKIQERRKSGEEEAEEPTEDIALLREIRDALNQRTDL